MPENEKKNSEQDALKSVLELAKERRLGQEWEPPLGAGLEDMAAAAVREYEALSKQEQELGRVTPAPEMLPLAEAELREARQGRMAVVAASRQLRALYLADCRLGVEAARPRWKRFLSQPPVNKPPQGRLKELSTGAPQGHFEHLEAMLDGDGRLAELDLERSKRYRFAMPVPQDGSCKSFEAVAGVMVFDPESVLLLEHGWGRKASEGKFGAVVRVYGEETLEVAIHPAVLGQMPKGCRGEMVKGLSKLGVELGEHLGGEVKVARGGLADGARGWWSLRVKVIGGKSRDEVEGAVRVVFEGALFEKGAVWVKGTENGEAGGELWSREILEKEYPDKVAYQWCIEDIREEDETERMKLGLTLYQCRLKSSLGRVFPAAAVDAIGRVLWAAIKPDPRHGTPPTLERDHRQGDSGLISVWTRRGIAVATSTTGAVGTVKPLEELLKEMSRASDRAHTLAEELKERAAGPLNETQHRELRELVHAYAGIRVKIVHPDYRLLRSLFDRVDHLQIHRVLLDIQLAEEQASQTAAAQKASQRLHQLEIFIVGFYSFELFHELAKVAYGEENHMATFLTAFFASLPVMALTWLHLSDEEREGTSDQGAETSREERKTRHAANEGEEWRFWPTLMESEARVRRWYRPRKFLWWLAVLAIPLVFCVVWGVTHPHEKGSGGPLLRIVNTYIAPVVQPEPRDASTGKGKDERGAEKAGSASQAAGGKAAAGQNPASGEKRPATDAGKDATTAPPAKGAGAGTGAKKGAK